MALADNLQLYWNFNDNATDQTGNGWDGSITGASYAAGKLGNCLSFDGTDDKMTFGNLNITGNFTISFWVYVDASQIRSYPVMLVKGTDGNENYEVGGWDGSKWLCCVRWSTSGRRTDLNTTLTTGTWHHLVMRFDGTTWDLWKDGSSASSTTAYSGQTPVSSNTASIGFDQAWGSANSYFTGDMDEVGIWTRALTNTEIGTLYNSGNGLAYPFTTSKNMFVNVSDVFRPVSEIHVNVGDVFRPVVAAYVNVGDVWKSIF